jgi:hypothetical protein
MIDDPIVAEIRQARENYARQFGNDLRAICRDLQQKQAASGRKVIAFPPNRVQAASSPNQPTTAPK